MPRRRESGTSPRERFLSSATSANSPPGRTSGHTTRYTPAAVSGRASSLPSRPSGVPRKSALPQLYTSVLRSPQLPSLAESASTSAVPPAVGIFFRRLFSSYTIQSPFGENVGETFPPPPVSPPGTGWATGSSIRRTYNARLPFLMPTMTSFVPSRENASFVPPPAKSPTLSGRPRAKRAAGAANGAGRVANQSVAAANASAATASDPVSALCRAVARCVGAA